MNTEHDDERDANWTANELLVLRSAELDLPPRGADERALSALGVGAVLGVAGASLSKAPLAQLGKGAWWLKWSTLAAFGAAVVGAALVARRPAQPTPRPALLVASPASAAPAAASDEAALPPAPQAPAALPTAAAAERAPSSAPTPRALTAPEAHAAKSGLADEIRLIDEARERLRHGDALGSLATLERYDRLLRGQGSMRLEAAVVQIEALQASGARERASELGERFLTRNPDSPYADYVQRLLSRSP